MRACTAAAQTYGCGCSAARWHASMALVHALVQLLQYCCKLTYDVEGNVNEKLNKTYLGFAFSDAA